MTSAPGDILTWGYKQGTPSTRQLRERLGVDIPHDLTSTKGFEQHSNAGGDTVSRQKRPQRQHIRCAYGAPGDKKWRPGLTWARGAG